jgi:hypothetical protein
MLIDKLVPVVQNRKYMKKIQKLSNSKEFKDKKRAIEIEIKNLLVNEKDA